MSSRVEDEYSRYASVRTVAAVANSADMYPKKINFLTGVLNSKIASSTTAISIITINELSVIRALRVCLAEISFRAAEEILLIKLLYVSSRLLKIKTPALII